MAEYQNLGDLSTLGPPHGIYMTCEHCKVYWYGCAAAADCPKCGAGKGYYKNDRDKCYCEKCQPDLFAAALATPEVQRGAEHG